MNNKKIYISAPMTGIKNYNRKTFFWTELYLRSIGYKKKNIINPYKLSKVVNKKIKNPEYSDYLDYDLRKLANADEIYFCKGWRKSHGCNKEYQMAVASNIMI